MLCEMTGTDPDAIEAESPTGRATLYVVLTRATQLLTLVRCE